MIRAPYDVARENNINIANTLVWVAVMVSSLALRFAGSNTSNAALTQLGGIFFGLSLIPLALEVVGGTYFRSPATEGQSGFAYWLPIAFLNWGSIASKLPFSLVPTPGSEGAYAASAVAGVSSGIYNWVIGFAAPHGESYALGSIGIIFLIAVVERTSGVLKVFSVLGVLTGVGVVFAQLHGARQVAFLISAVVFMVVTLGYLVAPEIKGFTLPLQYALPITWLFFAGIHNGWNRATLDVGLLGFYESFLTLGANLSLVGVLIFVVEMYLLVQALKYVGFQVVKLLG